MKSFFKYLLASVLGVILASMLMFLIFLGIFSAIVSSQDKPFQVKPQSILLLKLDQPIIDRKPSLPIPGFNIRNFGIDNRIGLNELLANIDKAAKDSNISGIYLQLSNLQAGVATVQEIRNALLDFKKSGKFIVSYGDFYTEAAYYLASVSDKVYMNPLGNLNFDGLSVEVLFFKKTMEKLDLEPQIIRHGKFKSAVEPLINDKMSAENREQISTYAGSIWRQLINEISQLRGIPVDEINTLADRMSVGSAEEAYQASLIDSILYKDQVLDILTGLSEVKNSRKLNFVSHNQYLKAPKQRFHKGLAKDKIAVIYASGDIVTGKGNESNIGSETMSDVIRKAREDSSVKAIVFRVNSGGGSALASEVIWRELDLARKVKPVIASMGDVAASGGYYILAAADTVLANPNTLTGSIGVFGVLLNAKDFFNNKLGISADVVNTNRHSDFGSVFRSMDAEERKVMQQMIDNIYGTFVTRVADGRGLRYATVDSIGEGRVWSGINAKEIGIVDETGGLTQAIEIAVEKTGLEHYRIVELPKLKDPLEQLMSELTGETSLKYLQRELGPGYRYYYHLKSVLDSRGIMARLPFEFEIY
ncbi:MAG: signal peptide peptidase SppA [Bacteroidales bacterium]|nr:signal peptide peptidase SppA [Bacteroidales bacterium]MBN2763766.1 signal peptide peptidase SppA [Bacteroidales bacterium]